MAKDPRSGGGPPISGPGRPAALLEPGERDRSRDAYGSRRSGQVPGPLSHGLVEASQSLTQSRTAPCGTVRSGPVSCSGRPPGGRVWRLGFRRSSARIAPPRPPVSARRAPRRDPGGLPFVGPTPVLTCHGPWVARCACHPWRRPRRTTRRVPELRPRPPLAPGRRRVPLRHRSLRLDRMSDRRWRPAHA